MSGLKGVMDDCKPAPHAESRTLQSDFVINVKPELLMEAGGGKAAAPPLKGGRLRMTEVNGHIHPGSVSPT